MTENNTWSNLTRRDPRSLKDARMVNIHFIGLDIPIPDSDKEADILSLIGTIERMNSTLAGECMFIVSNGGHSGRVSVRVSTVLENRRLLMGPLFNEFEAIMRSSNASCMGIIRNGVVSFIRLSDGCKYHRSMDGNLY